MRAKDLSLEASLPNVSTTTIENTLYKKGLARRKPGWKFALTEANKAERVALLKEYHPDKFDWRNVIFTDETPAKIGAQRGWHRSWRKTDETYHEDVKMTRQKKQDTLQFWACFAYGAKGPCHVHHNEEEEEKQMAQQALEEENKERKAACVLEQMSRSWLDKKGKVIRQGKKPPEARLYKRNSRENRNGVDGYRHREAILKPLLIPFAQELKKQGRNILVLEDNAPAHISHFDNDCFKMSDVIKMLWPANSPDANAIEQAWLWMRRHITDDYDVSTTVEECERQWREEWEKLSIEQINAWIDSIPKRIIQILEQEGGNNFHG